MTVLFLTQAERDKFAAVLEQDATSNEGLAKQMDVMPGPGLKVIADRYRAEAKAMRVVAARLRATKEEVIGGESF